MRQAFVLRIIAEDVLDQRRRQRLFILRDIHGSEFPLRRESLLGICSLLEDVQIDLLSLVELLFDAQSLRLFELIGRIIFTEGKGGFMDDGGDFAFRAENPPVADRLRTL